MTMICSKQYFAIVVSNLNIPQYEDRSVNLKQFGDVVFKIKEKFINHFGMVAIKDKNLSKQFSFEIIS